MGAATVGDADGAAITVRASPKQQAHVQADDAEFLARIMVFNPDVVVEGRELPTLNSFPIVLGRSLGPGNHSSPGPVNKQAVCG